VLNPSDEEARSLAKRTLVDFAREHAHSVRDLVMSKLDAQHREAFKSSSDSYLAGVLGESSVPPS
jgi:hypothetical protein